MRLILAAQARNQAKWVPVSRPDCAHNVTFKARPDAKPASTFAGRAFAGLRSYGKGANRTHRRAALPFPGLPQPVRPAALRTSVPGSSLGRDEQATGGEG